MVLDGIEYWPRDSKSPWAYVLLWKRLGRDGGDASKSIYKNVSFILISK
jgi:hypothetical protein